MGEGESGFICCQGARLVFFFFLSECVWNAPAVSLVPPAFDVTGSLGSPPRLVVYPPGSMVTLLVTDSRFLARNREAELKLLTFSSLLLFLVFLSFPFS